MWMPDKNAGLSGDFAKNNKLDNVQLLAEGLVGPEDVTFDQNGWLFTGLNDGRIIKIDPNNPNSMVEVVNTKGRPLGMKFDIAGNLIVADAIKGIVSVSLTGEISVLVDSFENEPFLFIDHLDIASNGDIYFSDASARFGVDNFILDFIETSFTGRVFKYSPSTGKTELVINDLFFANGIALGPNDEFLLVNETGKARVLKYQLKGEKKGKISVFIDELPAMPDNVYFDEKNTFWFGLIAMRDWRIEKLAPFPTLRRIIGTLPSEILKPNHSYGFVIGVDLTGKVTHNYQTETGFTNISGVVEHKGKLYLGALEGNSIGVFSNPNLQ